MNCIKCGREIPEGEMFCEVCAMPSVTVAPEEPAPRAKNKPVVKKSQAKKLGSGRKKIRRLTAALVIVSLLFAGSAALAALKYGDYRKRQEDLRIREASVTLREKEADRRDARIEELEKALEQAQKIIDRLQD